MQRISSACGAVRLIVTKERPPLQRSLPCARCVGRDAPSPLRSSLRAPLLAVARGAGRAVHAVAHHARRGDVRRRHARRAQGRGAARVGADGYRRLVALRVPVQAHVPEPRRGVGLDVEVPDPQVRPPPPLRRDHRRGRREPAWRGLDGLRVPVRARRGLSNGRPFATRAHTHARRARIPPSGGAAPPPMCVCVCARTGRTASACSRRR